MANENKYIKHGFVITIPLSGTNYSITATINKHKGTDKVYSVRLYLNREDIGLLDKMDSTVYTLTLNTVNQEVCNFVRNKYKKGHFAKYIDNYEYMLKCFDYGNEHFENEQSSNNK